MVKALRKFRRKTRVQARVIFRKLSKFLPNRSRRVYEKNVE